MASPIKTALFILAILCMPVISPAQEIYRLDLETSILLARQKSIRMQTLNQNLKSAALSLKASIAQNRTHVNLDMTLPSYSETIRQFEDSSGISFYPVRQNQLMTSLSISQPLPTDGSLYITTRAQNFIDYYANDRNTQLSSSIGLRQPIEAFFGFNNFQMNNHQLKLSYDLSMRRLKREELDLVYDISNAFFNMLSTQERMNILKQSLKTQRENCEIAQSKFKAGLIREVESLQMEVDLSLAINSYDMSVVEFASQVRDFKENLGINLSDSILVESNLKYQVVTVDVEKAVALALKSRPEMRENEIQVEMQEMAIKRQRAQGLPKGSIGLNYNFIGVGKDYRNIPMDATFNQTWQNLTSRPGSLGVALTASVPIVDWGENRARVQLAISSLKQSQLLMESNKISIEREIRTTVDRLNSSLRRLQLLEKGLVIAEKSFEISRQRYANGEIDSQGMTLEQDRVNTAYNQRLDAYITYKLLLSDIIRKTFFDFEKGISLVE